LGARGVMSAPSKPATPQPEAVPGCRWKWRERWGWALLPRRCVPPSVAYDYRPWKGRPVSCAALVEIRANPPTYCPAVICDDGPPGGVSWHQQAEALKRICAEARDQWRRQLDAMGPLGNGAADPSIVAFFGDQPCRVWPALPDLVRRCATWYRFIPDMAGRPPEALPRWREPTLAVWPSYPTVRRLPYRVVVQHASGPLLEDWVVQKRKEAPGLWSAHEAIPAHIGFRPREDIRAMRGRSVEIFWTDAGRKRWRVGKKRKKISAYSEYLGPHIRPFPYEADAHEWVQKIAVRYAEDVGGNFLTHSTPLIAQNRLWRAVVGRLFIDAAERRPLGKRTALEKDRARPTYVGRENARDLLLYDNPPLFDRDALAALSDIEGICIRAWQVAPDDWALPELDRLLRRNLNRTLYGESRGSQITRFHGMDIV
jgi:hypothetical protein